MDVYHKMQFDHLKEQLKINADKLEAAIKAQESAALKAKDLEQELDITKRQLRQFSDLHLQNFYNRRLLATKQYQEQYMQDHSDEKRLPPPVNWRCSCGFQHTDALMNTDEASGEDMVDIPLDDECHMNDCD